MRVLRLDGSDESKRAYLHLFTAANSGDVRGIEQIRRVSKIIDKLEAIGVKEHKITPNPESGEPTAGWRWKLQEGGGELWLENAEHGELVSRFNAVPWLPGAARYVAHTFELLDKMPEEDPRKPAVEPGAASEAAD